MKRLQMLIMFSILLITACGGEEIENNMSGEVSEFEFTTHNNKQMELKDLEGQWWITYFMYTNCTQVCPTTTANMVSLQENLQKKGINLQIISFTVDPEYDTPEVLREYGKGYQVDLNNWTFLTGYNFSDIKELSKKSFRVQLSEGSPGEVQFAHSTSFFLVNPDGEAVKQYDGMSMDELNIIIEDLRIISGKT